MRLFVTGATGFTGSRLVPLLLKNGHSVRCLYRLSSDRSLLASPFVSAQGEIDWVQGDVSRADALSASMQGVDAFINLVSLGFGHADSIVHAAQNAGIARCIFISTTAIFTQLDAESKSMRIAAQHAIETSGLAYTILRPTMIFGSARDRNMWRLIRFMRYSPVIPIFGDGNFFQQPIYIGDVAQAILNCLNSEKTICKSYNIAGKHPLTYNQVIDTIAAQMHKRVWKLYIPPWPVVVVMKFFERMGITFPIKAEQVMRLNENKNFDYTAAATDFGFTPLSFEEGIKLELETSQK